MKSRISVVIPAFNEERYLADCLNSILLEQTTSGFDFEIIVVDNASTDNTLQIASSFNGVKVVLEPRKGLLFARQTGFLNAHGDFIVQLDADSRLAPGWTKAVMKKMTTSPKLAGLSGPVVYYDLPLGANLLVRFYYQLAFVSYILGRFLLRRSSMIQASNLIIRKDILEKIGGYNTDICFYGEDTDLAKRIFTHGQVAFSLKLPVYTSARRFYTEGLFKVGLTYALNYLSVVLRDKPYSKSYTDVREKQPAAAKMSIKKLNRATNLLKTTALTSTLAIVLGTSHLAASLAFASKAKASELKPASQNLEQHFDGATTLTKAKVYNLTHPHKKHVPPNLPNV